MTKNTATICIVVLGEARSGKTALANYIATHGFSIVSASGVMKEEFCGGVAARQGRRTLVECGAKVLEDGNDALLGELIFDRCIAHDRAVVDGIRFRGTFEALEARAGILSTIYVDCALSVRRARFDPATEGMDFDELELHVTEGAVRKMKDLADLRVRWSGAAGRYCEHCSGLLDKARMGARKEIEGPCSASVFSGHRSIQSPPNLVWLW